MISYKQRFGSMQKATQHFTSIIKGLSHDIPLPIDNLDKDLIELINYHPFHKDLNLQELECIIVVKDKYNSSTLFIKCKECQLTTISRKSCIENAFGKFDFNRRNTNIINNILRSLIVDSDARLLFIKSYFCKERKCELCGDEDDLVIDHYPIPFKKIKNDFFTKEGIDTTFKDIEKIQGTHDWIFTDKSLKNKWIEYHDDIVKYRWLCPRCNSKMGSYGF